MGNYKFKLSDMMPNAWFYKLRDTTKAKKQSNSTKKPLISHPRRSIYHSPDTITPENFFNSPTIPKFPETRVLDFPRKSSKRRSRRKTIYKPSPRLSTSPASNYVRKEKVFPEKFLFSSSESSDDEFYKSPVSETESNSMDGHDLFNEFSSWSSSCSCRVTSSTTDIIIDMNAKSSFPNKNEKSKLFDSFSEIHLRPILTKPSLTRNENLNFRNQLKPPKQRKTSPGRKSISNSTRVKVKTNSPKIMNKKIQSCARKSVSSSEKIRNESQRKSFSKSFAVVKSSVDPMKDFRDSMVEMIVENGISASKDLEELLACYLTLNLEEYHGVIIKAFEQIWFEMAKLRV